MSLHRPTRREFLGQVGAGFGAIALGLSAGRARANMVSMAVPPGECIETGARSRFSSGPFAPVRYTPMDSLSIGGLPFSPRWYGDDFGSPSLIPFHSSETFYPGGSPPAPTESVDVAIVGGGLSGLATAYLLRHRQPVLFELHDRVGGTSVGERWRGVEYSLGGAYFITPDEGSFLHGLYRRLGLESRVRVSPSTDDVNELSGVIEPDFWSGQLSGGGLTEAERRAFAEYRALVLRYTEQYPDIPLDESPAADTQWIRDLDRLTLKQHITQQLTVPVPRVLQAAMQGYCYSSFNAGWEEISAASGWNFIAAEEYGRWVLPGGNAGLIDALWQPLQGLESSTPLACAPQRLRAGCRVVEVRVLGPQRVQVVYRGSDGVFRSLLARRVVMACPKHICRYVLTGLREDDPQKYEDLLRVQTAAYVVANVLLTGRIRRDFYDLFLLRDGRFPDANDGGLNPEGFNRVTDAVRADFTRSAAVGNGVLTLYWPLPFASSRFRIIESEQVIDFAERIVPELDLILSVLGLRRRDVAQVRLSRWGHSMPIASPGLIADGVCERIRAPWRDDIFFVNQDNWSLPAVETCLLEAEWVRGLVEAGL